ncbi:MAG: glycosyltransferase [Burkholderiales bacterium]|nr:glycosyltransferase [Opitutaceae bacterium]
MLSSSPDGTITAGLGVRRLLRPACAIEARWDALFLRINDGIGLRWPRWVFRWLVLHLAATQERDRPKVFTSHHSPFFASGHLVIIHDVIPFRQPERYPEQTFYTRHFLRTVMGAADGVVTISHTVRDALGELFPEVRGKLRVIPSYSAKVDALVVADVKGGRGREGGRFLMVGMTRRHKNLDWGAAGVEAAAQSVPGLRLDAVGVWPDFWRDVRSAAADPHRRSQLVLHDYVDEQALDGFYRGARALLYLSSDEGMGLPPLEALSRGCSVVCSDIPIFREVCGDAAFYVPLGDTEALARLIVRLAKGELDGEIVEKLAAGRRRIAIYGAERLAWAWRELLADYARWRKPPVI